MDVVIVGQDGVFGLLGRLAEAVLYSKMFSVFCSMQALKKAKLVLCKPFFVVF